MGKINKFFEHGVENPKYLVILVHGYGSSGEDLIALAPELEGSIKDAYFVSPNAHMPLMHPGLPAYQWFELENRDPKVMYPQVVEADRVLEIFVKEQLARFDLDYSNLILVGFSQGAMMSLLSAFKFEEEIAGVVAFSGRLISPIDLGEEIGSKPRTCLIHGIDDDVVPFGEFVQAKKDLDELEVDFEAHEIDGLGHSIDARALGRAKEFLNRIAN
jgi:phospholipase/carboxylesterase